LFCRGCGKPRLPLLASCLWCGYRARARGSLPGSSVRLLRVAALAWLGAAAGAFFMTSGVVFHAPEEAALKMLLWAIVLSPIFLVGFDLFLAIRLWRDPARWLLLLGLVMLGLTGAYAVAEVTLGHLEDRDMSKPTVQAMVGLATVVLAFSVTGLVRRHLPSARCPHCAAFLPLTAWRSCPACGIVLSSSRYRH
jgi:hypothetical protein